MSERKASWPLYLGVFTTSMAVLTLEIALTRIFSVSLWYHLAFMVISTALLGFGASGTFLTLRRGLLEKKLERNLTLFTGLMAIAIVVCFAIMVQLPIDPLAPLTQGLPSNEQTWQTILLILLLLAEYVLVVIPFFFAGLALGGTFSAFTKRISTLYFADLIGAGVGCLVVIGALWLLPGQGVVLFAAGLAALAAFFFSRLRDGATPGGAPSASWATILTAAGTIFLFALSPVADRFLPLYIPPSKPLSQAKSDPTIDLVYTGFTPFAKLACSWLPLSMV